MKYKNQSHSRLLVDGLDTFSEILSCIEKAQKTIRMNVFMWRNDASGRRILSALSAKIQKCPHIKIYIRKDNFGARVYNLQKLISFGKI